MKPPRTKSMPLQRTVDTRTAYDMWSETYDDHPNPLVAMARIALEKEFPDPSGMSIYEFGCGTGANLYALNQRGASGLCGADISGGMLSLARSRLEGCDVDLFHLDNSDQTFGTTETFDLILAILVLEHVEAMDAFFRNAAKHLSVGGVVYVSELHPDQSSKGKKAHFQTSDGIEISTVSIHRTEVEFVRSAKSAGLKLLSCTSWSPDDEVVKREAKAIKYKDHQLLLTMKFEK